MTPRATLLAYDDELIASIELPRATLCVWRGVGSGLTRRADDPPGIVWAVGDRGPNLKVALAMERYGVDRVAVHAGVDGVKVMPRPDIGPAISELHIADDRVTLVRSLPLVGSDRRALSGLPTSGGLRAGEMMVGIDGQMVAPDPSGADTEGIAATRERFVIGEEYGPSLLHVRSTGEVIARWVPEGVGAGLEGARYPVVEALPAIAAHRRLNRGFEAIAAAEDGTLLLAFQSPLAHPDRAAHEGARHSRLWRLDGDSGRVLAQWLHPLDDPGSFRRDSALGAFAQADVKVSELILLSPNRLLVLERGSATTKLYLTTLDPDRCIDDAHLDVATRPTLEELSALGRSPPALDKELVLSTDDLPEVDADLEGMVLLSPSSVLLVNDNDFGVEGVRTRFWRVDLDRNLA